MRTRSQSRNLNRQQQQVNLAFVEPFNLEEPIENPAPPVVTMDDTRTMAQLLEAPTEGYEDAIVVPEITADNFELKHDHFYDEVLERPEYVVPPPYTGNFMPPIPDLSFTGLDEFVNEPAVENCKAMPSDEEPKVVRKNDDAPIIKEWVLDDEEEDVS
ncbi:hypothetical protein Tco_0861255 [Tanacetum coccineum]|uniref:Reverse transcriptase domain-containing protein n=1 Tax=Tanacetum coccineum TaxID=301880 RepID=A0ABQ5BI37_9ASTR